MSDFSNLVVLNNASSRTNQINVENDPVEKIILLIGPSQNGKSTFANFLVRGCSLYNQEAIIFPIGTGIEECTKNWDSRTIDWTDFSEEFKDKENASSEKITKNCTIRIIDTPGTGGTDEDNEEKNMQLIFDGLLKIRKSGQQKLSFVLLFVKYPQLLTNQLKRNIEFYKKMIPEIMNSNLILIITHVKQSKNWIAGQMIGGRPAPEVLFNKIREEVQQLMGLANNVLMMETIDSFCSSGSEEEKHAIGVRMRILNKCTDVNTPGVSLNTLRLPKTKQILDKDKLEIIRLQSERIGIIRSIEQFKRQISEITTNLIEITKRIKNTESQLEESESELKRLNTFDLIEIKNKSIAPEKCCKFNCCICCCCCFSTCFSLWLNYPINITASFPIRKTNLSKGFVLDNTHTNENHIGGRVIGPFWSKSVLTVQVYTYKKDQHRDDITRLENEIDSLTKDMNLHNEQLQKKSQEASKLETSLETFQNRVTEIDETIKCLSSEYISLADIETSSQERKSQYVFCNEF